MYEKNKRKFICIPKTPILTIDVKWLEVSNIEDKIYTSREKKITTTRSKSKIN